MSAPKSLCVVGRVQALSGVHARLSYYPGTTAGQPRTSRGAVDAVGAPDSRSAELAPASESPRGLFPLNLCDHAREIPAPAHDPVLGAQPICVATPDAGAGQRPCEFTNVLFLCKHQRTFLPNYPFCEGQSEEASTQIPFILSKT